MKAVIILSGGLDSTTCMGIAAKAGYELYPITFDYRQRQHREIVQAQKVAEYYGVADRHRVMDCGFLGAMGGSSLTDMAMQVRTSGVEEDEIPNTYVPARNLIFLSLAAAFAEVVGAKALFIGVNALDYSGYPDCRPAFIDSFTKTLNLGTKAGVTSEDALSVEVPLIHLTKEEIIRLGVELDVPYHLTTSCYLGEEVACGVCDSCRLRLQGFQSNHVMDPIPYRQANLC